MLKLENVDKSYVVGHNRLHVLKSVDLTIGEGEMVSIMGSSGSGKSTLMNILGLLDNYDTERALRLVAAAEPLPNQPRR